MPNLKIAKCRKLQCPKVGYSSYISPLLPNITKGKMTLPYVFYKIFLYFKSNLLHSNIFKEFCLNDLTQSDSENSTLPAPNSDAIGQVINAFGSLFEYPQFQMYSISLNIKITVKISNLLRKCG